MKIFYTSAAGDACDEFQVWQSLCNSCAWYFVYYVALWSWSNRKSLCLYVVFDLPNLILALFDPLPKCTLASSSTAICTERHFPGWLSCLAVLLAILDFTFCREDQKACSDQKKEGQQLPWRQNMKPKVIFVKPCLFYGILFLFLSILLSGYWRT